MHTTEPTAATLRGLKAALEQGRHPNELTHERYDETHELFERSSDQQQLILHWLQALILSEFANFDPLKILSVGCGSGILDNPLVASIATKSQQVEYTAVDPNAVACRRFRNDFDEQQLENVELDIQQQTIESVDTSDHFHVIHLVHSLYYFKDPACTIERLLKLLAPDGKLVIVLAPNAKLNQLASCFWTHHQENGIWFSDGLADHLAENNLTFAKHRIDGEVDVQRCFDSDCRQGEMLLDFITQSDCQHLDDDVLQLCQDYLRSIGRQEDDSLLVPHPADAFVVTAPVS